MFSSSKVGDSVNIEKTGKSCNATIACGPEEL